ncbi:MAG TPA: ABC transporter ATP-binding protein [Lacunisphaera sp.]|nr:ABC transporter ATP-binding protein [Lacunisphaera sp.]
MTSIQVQQLTKQFGPVVALRELDLSVLPGELFFLLGPSGCGKTTLLRCLAGFYRPDGGRILFGGEDVTRLEPHKRNAGMVFQSYALWPHLTVAENVAFGLRERKVATGEADRRVAEALASVRMDGFAARRPNELSGGQQQRVALARALVIRPRCLLLDEPLSNLDAKLRVEMRGEIRRICQEHHLTTVYVTHDQKEALAAADRMAILDGGRILQVGTPREVYKRPRSRTVADFIGETDFVAGRVTASGGGRCTVDTALGPFDGVAGDPDHRPAAGESVTVSIRPECWELKPGPAARNSVRGRIGECVYLGDVAHYAFVTTGGATLRIHERNPRHADATAREALNAAVDPDDVVILRP